MPRKIEPQKKRQKLHNDINNEFLEESPDSQDDETTNLFTNRKHAGDEISEVDTREFGDEVKKILEGFGADVSKNLSERRRKLEQMTQFSLKNSNKRIFDIWKTQQNQRTKLNEEYQKQAMSLFTQWESDLDKTKEHEEKLMGLFKQQQKIFQQSRAVQNQKLNALRQLHEQFTKGTEELDRCQEEVQNTVQSELKKEMSLLVKKILMETQQQEMANVKKSLHSMLI